MTSMPTCKGKRKDGTPCPSRRLLGNGYCQRHQKQALQATAGEACDKWTRERLEAAIAEHGGPEGLDLAAEDLSGLDLREIDLHKANLWWAVLSREQEDGGVVAADLTHSNLRGAALVGARLQKVRLVEADLRGSDLSDADLRAANLLRANMDDATMVGARLQGASLVEATLKGAELTGADLQAVDAERVSMPTAELESAKLQGARLFMADLSCSRLWRTALRRANLVAASLQHASLHGADLRQAALLGADLQGADLSTARLEGASMVAAALQGANLSAADLRRVGLRGANLQGVDLSLADCSGLDFVKAADHGLHGIRFYRALLDHTRMKREQLGRAIGDEASANYQEAKEAYLSLKQNFESLGDYEGATWAYIKERQMEKACSAPWRSRRFYGAEQLGDTKVHRLRFHHPRVWAFYLRHTSKWTTDWLVELVCHYGEGPWQTLVSMGVVYLLFAAFYWLTGAVVREVSRSGGIVHFATTRSLVDVLLFSAGAFTTMDPKGVAPAAPWVQFVATLEALLGIGLTGLLGFVLGNRIRRS